LNPFSRSLQCAAPFFAFTLDQLDAAMHLRGWSTRTPPLGQLQLRNAARLDHGRRIFA
jgi:hypothetical protein